MTIFLGFGAAAFVGNEGDYESKPCWYGSTTLAKALGGDFLFAFVSAIAFATILAVVAGLVLTAASAFAHDFYNEIIRKGNQRKRASIHGSLCVYWSSGIVYYTSVICSNIERSILVSLAFAVAASANLPVILFTIYWALQYNRCHLWYDCWSCISYCSCSVKPKCMEPCSWKSYICRGSDIPIYDTWNYFDSAWISCSVFRNCFI